MPSLISEAGASTSEITQGYWFNLHRIAQSLRAKGGYWGMFTTVEALMGWLHAGERCVYCGLTLVEARRMIDGSATADHLLPKNKYPELDFANRTLTFRDPLNAVPACGGCNTVKRSWDPNTMAVGRPQLYHSGKHTRLTCEMQEEFIRRATTFINGRREERHVSSEQDCMNWSEALEEVRRHERPSTQNRSPRAASGSPHSASE